MIEINQKIKDLAGLRIKVDRLEEELSTNISTKLNKQSEYNSNRITEEIKKLGDGKYKEINKWVTDLAKTPIKKSVISGLIGGILGSIIIGAGIFYYVNRTNDSFCYEFQRVAETQDESQKSVESKINNLEKAVSSIAVKPVKEDKKAPVYNISNTYVQPEKKSEPAITNVNNSVNIARENRRYQITIEGISDSGQEFVTGGIISDALLRKFYDMDEKEKKAAFSDQEDISIITESINRTCTSGEILTLFGGENIENIKPYLDGNKENGYITAFAAEIIEKK
jgi:hypothetical protein